jgi:hypothetical protein
LYWERGSVPVEGRIHNVEKHNKKPEQNEVIQQRMNSYRSWFPEARKLKKL